jgi:acyl-coenzyme A synthetase/AMP-(fatty) acid ligase
MSLVFEDGEWRGPERFNFARDVVEAVGANDPTWPALTFVDEIGAIRRFTYTELSVLATRWSAYLEEQDLQEGDRLLVVLGKRPEWYAVMLAAMRRGAVSIPCHMTITADELATRAEQCGATVVVADHQARATIEESAELLEYPPAATFVEDLGVRLIDYPQSGPCADTHTDDIAFVVYTPGTAGPPKAVAHTHGAVLAARVQAEHWLDARPDDLVWCTSEMGWADAVWNAFLGPWSCGAEVLIHDALFDPHQRLELIERLGVTVLCQTPAEYRRLTLLDEETHHDLSRLQHAVSTGETLDTAVVTSFREAFGVTIHDGYGQTEDLLVIANAPGGELRPGSIGRPLPGHDVAVIDENGERVRPGIEGDIAVDGHPPTMFAGYLDAPDESTGRLRNAWYVTGDRGTQDRDGYFWLTGRAEDTIVVDGVSFGPAEVESALLRHGAVAEAAVIGKPDPRHGHVVKAFVVVEPQAETGPHLREELQEHCRRITPEHQHVRELELVDSLPKTANGKVRRLELRTLEAERARAEERAAAAAAGARRPRPPERRPAPVRATPKPEQPKTVEPSSRPDESRLVSRLHAYERGDEEERVDPRAFVTPSPPLDFSKAREARAAKRRPPATPEDEAPGARPEAEAPPAE